ncbi:MAG: efflux RND transporter permease subunit [Gemmatimonadota bacterium]
MIRLALRRPVAVAMAYFAVALLGVQAWGNLPVELLPDTQLPRLQVDAGWPGASPEVVEAFLTSPVEAEVQQLRGVERITSVSEEGQARIEVEFIRDTDMNFVRLELSERLSTLRETLHPGIQRLTVQPYIPQEFQAQYERAFLRYTFTGPRTLEALRIHLEEEVVPELTRITGVSQVNVSGGRERVVEVELDRNRMEALGLTPAEVAGRIGELDLVREAGVVREGDREWTVAIRNRPGQVDDLRDAVLTARGDRVIRIGDVGRVLDTYEDPRMHYRIDGRPAVSFTVTREIRSNTVEVADRVKARMSELESLAPAGTRFILDQDQSEDIRRELTDLRSRALVSAVVIFLVLLLFLRSIPSALIVFATIAFSVLIAVNLLYLGGLSLNLLTLMGLALGFGLIVDNAIVVLESVYRRWQGGEERSVAAEMGSRQVALPILASTLTTLIVFIPFVYLQGEVRVYYVPLAIVVALTLGASLAVAFTFIPALAARILPESREAEEGGGLPDPGHGTTPGPRPFYVRFYAGLVGLSLRFPWVAVMLVAGALGGSYYLFDQHVTRGVLWGGMWGQQTYIDIRLTLPRGADIDELDELTRFFEERVSALPEVERFETTVNPTAALVRITFPEHLENTGVPVAIKDQMMAYSLGFSGAQVRVYGFGPSFYGGGGAAPNYSITIRGYNYDRVREIAEDLATRLTRLSRVESVDTNASGNWFQRDRAVEYVAAVDRDAIGRHDLTVEEVVGHLGATIRGQGGERRFVRVGGEDLRFDVKLEGFRELDVRALEETLVHSRSGVPLRLGDLVTVQSREVLSQIRREDQQYERRVAYEFRGPQRLGDVVNDAVLEATLLPPGYSVERSRGFEWSTEDQRQIYSVLALALLLITMVTAALFESFRQPFCVLLTVPMALIGVFLIFFFTEASFTREAYVGVIMMGGIVVNNAILLVDRVNQVRQEQAGLSLADAVLEGTLDRVRPILMTTTTTVLGLLPLVLFTAYADATIWNALAYTLIGGLLASTLLVLTVTPALYLLMERGPDGVARERAEVG